MSKQPSNDYYYDEDGNGEIFTVYDSVAAEDDFNDPSSFQSILAKLIAEYRVVDDLNDMLTGIHGPDDETYSALAETLRWIDNEDTDREAGRTPGFLVDRKIRRGLDDNNVRIPLREGAEARTSSGMSRSAVERHYRNRILQRLLGFSRNIEQFKRGDPMELRHRILPKSFRDKYTNEEGVVSPFIGPLILRPITSSSVVMDDGTSQRNADNFRTIDEFDDIDQMRTTLRRNNVTNSFFNSLGIIDEGTYKELHEVDAEFARLIDEFMKVLPESLIYTYRYNEADEILPIGGFMYLITQKFSFENLAALAQNKYKKLVITRQNRDLNRQVLYTVVVNYTDIDGNNLEYFWEFYMRESDWRSNQYFEKFGVIQTLISVLVSDITLERTQDWAIPGKYVTRIYNILDGIKNEKDKDIPDAVWADKLAKDKVAHINLMRERYRDVLDDNGNKMYRTKLVDGVLYHVERVWESETQTRTKRKTKTRIVKDKRGRDEEEEYVEETEEEFVVWTEVRSEEEPEWIETDVTRRLVEPFSTTANSNALRAWLSSLSRQQKARRELIEKQEIERIRNKAVRIDKPLEDSDVPLDVTIGSAYEVLDNFVNNPTGIPDIDTYSALSIPIGAEDIVIANPPHTEPLIMAFLEYVWSLYTRKVNPIRAIVILLYPGHWTDHESFRRLTMNEWDSTTNGPVLKYTNLREGKKKTKPDNIVTNNLWKMVHKIDGKPYKTMEPNAFAMEINDINIPAGVNTKQFLFYLAPPPKVVGDEDVESGTGRDQRLVAQLADITAIDWPEPPLVIERRRREEKEKASRATREATAGKKNAGKKTIADIVSTEESMLKAEDARMRRDKRFVGGRKGRS